MGKRQQIVKIPQTTQLQNAIKAFLAGNVETRTQTVATRCALTSFYSLVATIEALHRAPAKIVTMGRRAATATSQLPMQNAVNNK